MKLSRLVWLLLLASAAVPGGYQKAKAADSTVPQWVARYTGFDKYWEAPRSVAVDSSGNVFVAGTTREAVPSRVSRAWAIKLDAETGRQLWAADYEGAHPGRNEVRGMVLDAAGNVCLAVASYGGSAAGDDYVALKYDGSTGAELMQARYNGPGSGSDEPSAVGVDSAGNLYLTGTSYVGPSTGQDFMTIKFDVATGRPIWSKGYSGVGAGQDEAVAIALDLSGNVFVTGSSNGGLITSADYATVKYDGTTGNLLWAARYVGPAGRDEAAALAVDAAGNPYVTGASYGGTQTDYDYATVAYEGQTGQLRWLSRYNGPGSREDRAVDIAVDGEGNPCVTGSSLGETATLTDYATLKYSGTTGTEAWVARYDSPTVNRFGQPRDYASAISVDLHGDVLVTGFSVWIHEAATVKYGGATGARLWSSRHYGGDAMNSVTAADLAVDASGNVVLTAYTQNTEHSGLTLKYDGRRGGQLWKSRHEWAVKAGIDRGVDIQVDRDYVYVAGTSGDTTVAGNGFDYVVAKYRRRDGEPVWIRHYNRHGADEATALAIDSSGNVYVTGSSGNYGSSLYATVKFDGITGAEVWKSLDSFTRGAVPTAIVVDAAGNVIVTGYDRGDAAGTQDFVTIKYNGVTGARMWGQPARHHIADDVPTDIAVDAAGNVFVTGWSHFASTTATTTVKYNGTNGLRIWKDEYAGGLSWSSLAVDADGDVYVASEYRRSLGERGNFLVVKYNGANGAQRWGDNWGTPEGQDRALDISLGRTGANGATEVYLAGQANGSQGAVVKYHATTGQVLWGSVFPKPSPEAGSRAASIGVSASGVHIAGGVWDGGPLDILVARLSPATGQLEWAASYNGPGDEEDSIAGAALDPVTNDVFVSCKSWGGVASNEDMVALRFNASPPPAAPAGLRVGAEDSWAVRLTWQDSSENETEFRIWGSRNGDTPELLGIVPANGTSFEHNDTRVGNEGHVWTYWVEAWSGDGSAVSDGASAIILREPSKLQASVSDNGITLRWNNPSLERRKVIERARGSRGPFVELASVPESLQEYVDTSAVRGVYYRYRLRTYEDRFDNISYSYYSDGAAAGPLMPAPTGLTALALSSTAVYLSWHDNSNSESGFILEGRDTGTVKWFHPFATTGADVTTYQSNYISAAEKTFAYRVRCTGDLGDSEPSNVAVVSLMAAPNSLAVSVASADSMRVSWADRSQKEDGYSIERRQGSTGTFIEIHRTGSGVTVFTDSTGLGAGTTYQYRVRAFNTTGFSSYATSPATPFAPPAAPTEVKGLARSSTQMLLTWTDRSNNETGFRVERSTDGGGTYATLSTTGPNARAYTDAQVSGDRTYRYRVTAVNGMGSSAPAVSAEVVTMLAPRVTGTTVPGDSSIRLTWQDRSSRESGYAIERRRGTTGNFTEVHRTAADVSSFTDSTGLLAGETYFYQVRAFNSTGFSTYGTAPGVALAVPAAPNGVTGVARSSTQVLLTWTDRSVNENGFRVERSADDGNSYAVLVTTGPNATSFSDLGIAGDRSYVYRVSAVNAVGASAGVVSGAVVTIAAPSGLTAASAALDVNLSWSDNSSRESGYFVERSAGTAFAEVGRVGADIRVFADRVPGPGTYVYRVRGYNGSGHSTYTRSISVSAR